MLVEHIIQASPNLRVLVFNIVCFEEDSQSVTDSGESIHSEGRQTENQENNLNLLRSY